MGTPCSMEGLIDRVRDWGHDKGIIEHGTVVSQSVKTIEEASELLSAVNANDRNEIVDAIGDTMVTLILQAEMQGLDAKECLQSAYKQIAAREGRMINGRFIKNET